MHGATHLHGICLHTGASLPSPLPKASQPNYETKQTVVSINS